MSLVALEGIRRSIKNLNPAEIRDRSHRPVRLVLYAPDEFGYRQMETFFLDGLEPRRRAEAAQLVIRGTDGANAATLLDSDVAVYDERLPVPRGGIQFSQRDSEKMIDEILNQYEELDVALARTFEPFRRPFISKTIQRTAKENALFSLATALPDIVPTILTLPWAVTEFASDTAFITMNQVRMAFLLAAASDREVSYLRQRSEIASLVGGAFGWRALSRQLVGKIPFGGGLLPKAAIAYAGTYLTGVSLERFYRIGYQYTKPEREQIYHEAYRRGKDIAQRLLDNFKPGSRSRLKRAS